MACHGPRGTHVAALTLAKAARSRVQEDTVASKLVVQVEGGGAKCVCGGGGVERGPGHGRKGEEEGKCGLVGVVGEGMRG